MEPQNPGPTVIPEKPRRFLTKKAVLARVPYSSNHLDRLEAAGQFPRRIKLSPNRVVWVESEIDEYQDRKIRERDLALAAEGNNLPAAASESSTPASEA